MKKSLLVLSLLISVLGLRSQSLTISTSTTNFCFNTSSSSSNTMSAFVVTTPTTTAFHSWNVVPASSLSCGGSPSVNAPGTGSAGTITFPCCGTYSVYVSAHNSGGYNVGSTMTVVNIGCSIGISSPNNFLSCNGSTVVMFGSGGSNYSWTNGTSTLSTTGTLAVSPTVNTCYTLSGTTSGCTSSAVACVTVSNQNPTITISGVSSTTANCQWSTYSMTASGATNYTWVPNWLGYSSTAVGYLGSWPCYTVIGSNGGACTATAMICPTITIPPALTITANPSTTVCPGTTVTLTASSGPTSYTWSTWNPNYSVLGNNSTVGVVPTNFPNQGWNSYTLNATYPNGCNANGHIFLYLSPGPSVTASGGTLFCTGQSKTLTVSGTGSFTWTSPSGVVGTGNSVVVSPTASTCYTVSNGGCNNTICLGLASAPNLTITSSSSYTANCANTYFNLAASGANSYQWYNQSGLFYTGPTATVYPVGNTCYTLVGSIATNCTASAVHCITVTPGPTLNVSASPGFTVCAGTPVTLTVSGAGNYSWTQFPSTPLGNSSTLAVTPTLSTYTLVVTGNDPVTGCPVSKYVYLYPTAGPSITALGSNSICPGQFRTLFTTSSGPYSWWDGNSVISTASLVIVTPTANTCYTLTAGSNTSCNMATKCFVMAATPTITASGSSVCAGSTGYIYTGGGVLYTIPSASSTAGWIAVNNVNGNTCYTVTGYNSAGCTNTAVACFTVVQPAVLSNTATLKTVCAGQSVTLATSPNVQVFQIYGSQNSTQTGTAAVVTPTVSGNYSVVVNGAPCWSTFMTSVIVVQPPTVMISGNTTVCPGGNLNLTASGANTYVWSTNATGANISVSPSAATCYTVTGTNSSGCSSSAVHCVGIPTVPVLIGPSSATVCRGTSQTFTASGASTYTWNTSANSSTINVIPLVTTAYSVTGTDANGCTGSSAVTLVVDTTCSDVWPGDANSDGVVGTTDVLEIGLAYNATGSARSPGGNSYVSQRATNWSGSISTGKNKCHADCNGDGTIDDDDTLAIFNNFAQSHGFRSSGSTGNDITVVPDQPYYVAGTWGRADIFVGDAGNMFQMYGLTFDLDFSSNVVDNGQAYLVYTPSFLNNNNQNVEFRKQASSGGKFYAASVRTDHADVYGQGKIAELHFKLLPGTEGQFMNLSLGNSVWINTTGVHNPLGANAISVQIAANETAVADHAALKDLRLIPNPASDRFVLLSTSANMISYMISDVSGRAVREGSFTHNTEIAANELAPGVYFVRCKENETERTIRLVIQH